MIHPRLPIIVVDKADADKLRPAQVQVANLVAIRVEPDRYHLVKARHPFARFMLSHFTGTIHHRTLVRYIAANLADWR